MESFSKIHKNFDTNIILESNKKNRNNEDLKAVAQEFESLFINELLKRANSAKLAKTIFGSDSEDTYKSLLNQERAKILAEKQNFGIAEALVKQFSGRSKSSSFLASEQKKENK